MSEATQRLIPACFVALILHGVALCWQIHGQTTLPTPFAAQRIAVSLGARPVAKESPPEPKQEYKPEKKKKVIPQPKPRPKLPALCPLAKPVVQPATKPQPVQEQKIIPPPLSANPPQETQTIPEEAPPLHPELGSESTTTDTASRVIQQASPLYQINPPPKYPRLAKRRGLEGVVLLEVFVDILGSVKELRIFNSSGHSVLDRAALTAVRRWKFRSGTVAGASKEMWVKVPVRFQLKGN
jgi:protein TonB